MQLHKAISSIYSNKWSYINTFSVRIQFSEEVKKNIKWDNYDEEKINLNIVSIDTPQFTNQNIEVFVGNRWKLHNGRDEPYKFSITFRDQDQMLLYRKFVGAYQLQYVEYFDTVKMHIELYKDADYFKEVDKKVFDFKNSMIDSVSQLQFNHQTEAQIAEFTVQFKCTNVELNSVY